ncbi:MAG: hypothetical protein AMXMBFR33_70070 [Candidatus Xenobia bacterium]
MVKTLTKHGNSYALIIERPIMELLGIDADTPLSITTDGKALVIHPVHDEQRDERFRAALEKVNERHAGALRRLAE